jgi:CBS domain protein
MTRSRRISDVSPRLDNDAGEPDNDASRHLLLSDSVEDALGIIRMNKIRHLPVRDRETKRVGGIVSLTDLALKAPSDLYGDISKLAFRRTSADDYAGQRAN